MTYGTAYIAKCPKLSSQKAPPGGPYIPRCGRQQQEDQTSLFLGVTVVRLHGASLNQIQTVDYFSCKCSKCVEPKFFIPNPVGLWHVFDFVSDLLKSLFCLPDANTCFCQSVKPSLTCDLSSKVM
jgi:hypothetical protein